MGRGNNARRKIRDALRNCEGHRVEAKTVSELRKKIGAGISGLDFEKNLRAMKGAGELTECNLQAPHVAVALPE
jgi:hypothetical protein